MEGFLIFILIVVALYYLGKWYIKRKIRRFFGQFGQQGSSQQSEQHKSRKTTQNSQAQEHPDKKKVFTADEGEYVEFEEIKD